ncbi:endo alpha-1,4 polygalactosaminidase [Streptomyces luteolifulvus]|uniref:Endo alpha-1,4 polygalactosaminidase n=1 Tax=Streptomyces luteolifulvus TaxID=2615112 RepID=A0A6H9US37_9ACTN|nr:endo alpha-1,4 polygalactosaminidase [Streptomyces luteolifulvus]KAB1141262.1 endo alpha-1,4 polygalactosaminidase [Streptomyces luteolifulvus]
MSRMPVLSRKKLGIAAACAAALAGTLLVPATASADPIAPPTHAGVDYQIGGAYTPPEGVQIVIRDHGASPAAGLYNVCYVNTFQAQPGAESEWDADLLLRDASGNIVYDTEWKEALLDIRSAEKRERIMAKVGPWIDGCRDHGFQAIEPDNYDSYLRSGGLLSTTDAQEFIKLQSARAHNDGLAIGQKNTAELAANRVANGLDFAVSEECGQYVECGDYTAAFGDNVIVIEYTDTGLADACAGWGDMLSIVQRDVQVSPAGSPEYVRQTC